MEWEVMIYPFEKVPEAITEINVTRAFTHMITQWTFVSLIHGSYIKMWSIVIRWLSVLSCMQRISVFANSVMLFNKDIMWSTRQYETILREEPRYWHAKNPVKLTIFIGYSGIQNQLMNTHIFDNQEEDTFKNKLTGVVNC